MKMINFTNAAASNYTGIESKLASQTTLAEQSILK